MTPGPLGPPKQGRMVQHESTWPGWRKYSWNNWSGNPKEEMKVLILENLSCNISFTILALCREHNIPFIFLLPNSTQLLDVTDLAPLKKAWRRELDIYKSYASSSTSGTFTILKNKFASLLKTILENNAVNYTNNLTIVFAACRIISFNPKRVLAKLHPWIKR
jgi:hypothetical protein